MLNLDQMNFCFVCVGAGKGRRFGSDKVSARLGDRSVLETSIAALRTAVPSAPVVAVVAPEAVEQWREVLERKSSGVQVVAGGVRRQDSVRLGIERAAELGAEIVAVHDGARPLVHPNDVTRVIDGLGDGVAAILCRIVSDTVKRIDDDGVIIETIDRDHLRLATTPQVFRVAALEVAWRSQDLSFDWSDEAALLEAEGCEVRSVMAEHPNPKLTVSSDLDLVSLIVGKGP